MALDQLQGTGVAFPPGEPDVQRTTFSLDVLGRYICSTYEEATTNPDFDVVVVGSGMYGAYAAAKVHSESGLPGRTPLRVLVLEAGPFLVQEHGQNIPGLGLSNPFRPGFDPFSPEAQRTRDLVWGMGWRGNTRFPGTAYCVGGKSIYWGGWCPRLRDTDLQRWPVEARLYLTSPPQTENLPDRLAPPRGRSLYEAVEYEIGVQPADDFVFDPVGGPDDPPGGVGLNTALGKRLAAALEALRASPGGTELGDPEPPPIAVQTQSFVSGVFSPDKYSSLTHLTAARRSEAGRPDRDARIFLVPNAHVSHLVPGRTLRDGADITSQHIAGVDLFVDGQRRSLALKPDATVILALGCIESTRLALESFPTAPRRVGGEIMGRNLMAHLRFDFPFTVDRTRFRRWVAESLGGKALRDELQTASFHIQADSPDGRYHLQVYATGQDKANTSEEGLLYRMIPNPEIADNLSRMQSNDKIRLIFRACGEMLGDPSTPVHAAGTSWIDLAGAVDRDQAFDHARAYVHYADVGAAPIWRRMRAACEALARELGADELPGEDRHEVGSTWHDSGTLFMGDDPEASVTDASGHFHHMLNVVCVDQAIFPTVGSANPVLTGLCLARKAAETVVSRCVSEPEPDAARLVAEAAEGFVDLLAGSDAGVPFSRLWRANHPRFTDGRAALIAGDTILEVHGEAGLGILFFDHPDPFGDFELRLQWKAFANPAAGEATANSGVFLRMPQVPVELTDAFYAASAEVQIDDTGYDVANRRFGSPRHRTGAVYDHLPARVHAQKRPSQDGMPGFWNGYRILVRGHRITVVLNGRVASEGDLPPGLASSGRIGFQYHTGKVQFRAIRAKRL